MILSRVIFAMYLTASVALGEWQRYFAWWPVTVDAYCVSEIQDHKMSYLKWGWVERRWHIWTDEDGEHQGRWRYRLDRSSGRER